MYTQHLKTSLAKFRVLLVMVMAFAAGMATLGVPMQAHAQGLAAVTCSGEGSIFWSPGVTNQSQTITASYQAYEPTCLNVLGLSLTSVSGSSTSTSPLSCTELFPAQLKQTWNLTWSDGETSTLNFIPEYNQLNGIVSYAALGNITSGRFSGSTAYLALTGIDLNGILQNQCATPAGLSGADAQVFIQIYGL
ncbi:hypothetical protein ISP15_16310 [Dyella jejuensis]|uniref:Uncharacterized protein n=1 Tax=Dyella jejuensis TaxID=1432009 RepID=A0ABW8JLP8_9GAMM